ncbi:MAG: hypothetical protein K8R88_13440 [Armatimonadetes bacterium]|nr:hypothetical protein [Armatimonadota bacterium]
MSLAARHAESFVQHAVRLIAIGFEDARATIDARTHEEVITNRITKAAHQRLITNRVPSPLRRFSISGEAMVESPGREGKQRRRIDIRVEGVTLANRPRLEVEAKCLRTGSHPISGYTGANGLQLFVEGEYATEQLFGAMLGYIQSNDSEYWAGKLLEGIQRETSLEGNCTALTDYAFEHGYKSHHSRSGLASIAIHHFLLTCS